MVPFDGEKPVGNLEVNGVTEGRFQHPLSDKRPERITMIKHEELTNPISCLNRATDDEMIFVLLARDVTAPETIRQWVRLRVQCGKNSVSDPQIAEALDCADVMTEQYAARAVIRCAHCGSSAEHVEVMAEVAGVSDPICCDDSAWGKA